MDNGFENASQVAQQSGQNTMPTTKADFWKKWWFTPYDMVQVVNPKPEDYHFMVELRPFVIKAGTSEKMPGTVANVYLSQMSRILAQDEDKMQHMSDFLLMEAYYKRLVVTTESLIKEDTSVPAYLQNVPLSMQPTGAAETPPWEEASKVAQTVPEPVVSQSSAPAPIIETVEESEREFKLNNDSFKYITRKDGRKMYYKNGQLTNEAEYSKAASML